MGRVVLAPTERPTTVAVTAGTPLMARAPLVLVGGRGRGVAVTGTCVWRLAGVVTAALLVDRREKTVAGTAEVATGNAVWFGCVERRASLSGAELTCGKMGSVRMAGGRAEAARPVLTVQAKATVGGSTEVGNTVAGSLLAKGSQGGSAPVIVVTKLSSPAGRITDGPMLMTGR